ncbi:hypothetical protein EVAR_92546_1 [Eumeta japonica]|uniref:Uncharacterized protein n=1 Tax=Eumeta variegata TaxID=151549 RepID=A0A4C1SX61_EUMVA|nr:hypothetical protein EVAR_92546_1 [Eumeta japonica]
MRTTAQNSQNKNNFVDVLPIPVVPKEGGVPLARAPAAERALSAPEALLKPICRFNGRYFRCWEGSEVKVGQWRRRGGRRRPMHGRVSLAPRRFHIRVKE